MTDGDDDPIRTMILGTPTEPTGVGHTISVKRLAELTGTHYMTALGWVTKGDLRGFKFGRNWTIITDDAITFLRTKSNQAQLPNTSLDTPDEPTTPEPLHRDNPSDSLG